MGHSTSSGRGDSLSESVRDSIEMYTYGEPLSLSASDYANIRANMQKSSGTFYRIENSSRLGDVREGETINIPTRVYEKKDGDNGALRSFTRSESAVSDMIAQFDNPTVYKTTGAVKHLKISQYSAYDQAESLLYTNNWKVMKVEQGTFAGKKARVVTIKAV